MSCMYVCILYVEYVCMYVKQLETEMVESLNYFNHLGKLSIIKGD